MTYLPQGGGHLVGEGPGDDHDVRLAGAGSEHHAKAVHVIARSGHVHHLHRAARQPEGHGPQRALQRHTQACYLSLLTLDPLSTVPGSDTGTNLITPLFTLTMQ